MGVSRADRRGLAAALETRMRPWRPPSGDPRARVVPQRHVRVAEAPRPVYCCCAHERPPVRPGGTVPPGVAPTVAPPLAAVCRAEPMSGTTA